MLFHANNKYIPQDIKHFEVNGHIIKRKSSAKYLGIILDEKLSFKEHTDYVYKSLIKYYGIFNQIKHIINRSIIRQLYFAFIYSRIKYGIEIYGNCANKHQDKLQVIQNGLLKLLSNNDRRTSTNLIHTDFRLLKVRDIYKVQVMTFVNKCKKIKNATVFL